MPPLRVVYIHGIHGHPAAEDYRRAWDAALERLAYVQGIETKMVYWADIRLGAPPEMIAEAHARAKRRKMHRFGRVRPQTNSALGYAVSVFLHAVDPVIRRITKSLITDVYLYFYGGERAGDIRDVILDRMDAVMRAHRPDVVIAHSWGSVIAYDYFTNRGYDGEVQTLITVGSPLGQRYVQEHAGGSEYPAGIVRWLNVFDAMDPATWPDRRISNDLPSPRGERIIRDVEIASVYDEDGKRDPHSWHGYLSSEPVQNEIFRVAVALDLAARAKAAIPPSHRAAS
ncbi:MAG: hypothetical protein M3P30_16730 [Chloroflexota bacterium]|nr:hypothetical protein [Chloroflexota bacterium]